MEVNKETLAEKVESLPPPCSPSAALLSPTPSCLLPSLFIAISCSRIVACLCICPQICNFLLLLQRLSCSFSKDKEQSRGKISIIHYRRHVITEKGTMLFFFLYWGRMNYPFHILLFQQVGKKKNLSLFSLRRKREKGVSLSFIKFPPKCSIE